MSSRRHIQNFPCLPPFICGIRAHIIKPQRISGCVDRAWNASFVLHYSKNLQETGQQDIFANKKKVAWQKIGRRRQGTNPGAVEPMTLVTKRGALILEKIKNVECKHPREPSLPIWFSSVWRLKRTTVWRAGSRVEGHDEPNMRFPLVYKQTCGPKRRISNSTLTFYKVQLNKKCLEWGGCTDYRMVLKQGLTSGR